MVIAQLQRAASLGDAVTKPPAASCYEAQHYEQNKASQKDELKLVQCQELSVVWWRLQKAIRQIPLWVDAKQGLREPNNFGGSSNLNLNCTVLTGQGVGTLFQEMDSCNLLQSPKK
jgi:hypothetical protein